VIRMIKIDNYFFEPTEFRKKVNENGKTIRSFSSKLHSQYTNSYMTFDIKLEGISPALHSCLLYLVNKNRDNGTEAESLTLIDEQDNSYTVDIPIKGYDYDIEEGEEGFYWWELKLEEVI
jgi:hypothetical protein